MNRIFPSFLLLFAVLFVSAPGFAEDSDLDDAYERIYALASDAYKKNLLTPSQARDLKAKLQLQVNTFNANADEKYLFPDAKVLAAMDRPYDLYDASVLNGWFEGARRYANSAGPGMSGKLGSRDKYKAYWESISMDDGVWARHVRALVNALENGSGVREKDQAEQIRDLDGKNLQTVGETVTSLIREKDLFLKRLKDPDPDVRFKTAFGLWDAVYPYFYAYNLADAVAPLLADKDARVRAEAIGFFGLTHDTSRQDQIAGLFSDPEEKVRRMAIVYMGWVKSAKYRSQIEALLKDSNETIREAAKNALQDFNEK